MFYKLKKESSLGVALLILLILILLAIAGCYEKEIITMQMQVRPIVLHLTDVEKQEKFDIHTLFPFPKTVVIREADLSKVRADGQRIRDKSGKVISGNGAYVLIETHSDNLEFFVMESIEEINAQLEGTSIVKARPASGIQIVGGQR